MFHMLDAMLVMYIDLPSKMNPGVSLVVVFINVHILTLCSLSRYFLHRQIFFFSTMEQVYC